MAEVTRIWCESGHGGVWYQKWDNQAYWQTVHCRKSMSIKERKMDGIPNFRLKDWNGRIEQQAGCKLTN